MATGSSNTAGTAWAGADAAADGGTDGGTADLAAAERTASALRATRLGTVSLLLSVLAATAPLMVAAGVMPTTFEVMGIVGQPLLFVILGVVLILFSFGYAELSRHVHNAGAFYSYIARGLGGTMGSGAALVALVAYSAVHAGVYGIFGYEVSRLFAAYLHTTVAWWIPSLAAVAVVGVLGWMRIDLNARLLGALLMVEVALVVIFDCSALLHPGADGLSLHAFHPGSLTGTGVGTAMSMCVAAFLGFEQAPVYAEETRRPHAVVPRVMILGVVCVAAFFVVSCWALTVATGPSHIVPAAREHGAGLLFFLTERNLGGTFTDVLHVLFVTGMFAAALSFHNVAARYAFAMAREGLLPAAFARIKRSNGAPGAGSTLQSVVSLVVIGAFAVSDGRPAGDPTAPALQMFTWMGNVGALGVTALMAFACVAVIVFFVRRGAGRAQVWRLTASAIAGITLFVIAGYMVKDFDVLVASGPRSALGWLLPSIIALAALVGLAQGLVLRSVRPRIHGRIGLGNQAFQLELAAEAATLSDSHKPSP